MTDVTIAAPDAMLGAVRSVLVDADEALMCVAFANQAGVELLAPSLARRRVRLLATTVFGGTTAAALGRAADLGAEVRVLNLHGGTYHPKLYLARSGTHARALVGSGNLTSGLLRNIEVGALLSGRGRTRGAIGVRRPAHRRSRRITALPAGARRASSRNPACRNMPTVPV